MSEIDDLIDGALPPRYAAKHGEGRIPQDIWDRANQTVDAYLKMQTGELSECAEDFLRSMIATSILSERIRPKLQ